MDRKNHFTASGAPSGSAMRGKPRAIGIFNQDAPHRLNNSGTGFTALVFVHGAKRRATAA